MFSFQFYDVHFIGYNSASASCLRFRLEIYKLLFRFSYKKLALATTALNFEHIYLIARFLSAIFLRSFDPGQTSRTANIFVSG
jgi:hypothetical protein